MWSHLKDKGLILPKITSDEINQQVGPVLRKMEEAGVLIDCDALRELDKGVESKIDNLTSRIYSLSGEEFNINSPQQLSLILFEKLRLPTRDLKRTKTGVSTGASELLKLFEKHPIIEPLLEYRELSKLLSTYLKPLPEMVGKDGRLHTTYGQETSTGRLTSANPNLQNIPIKGTSGTEIRRAFVAPKDHALISADYSQVELRIVACLADDPVMKEAFETGRDVHATTAAEIFNIPIDQVTHDQRRFAKTVNFGVLYGMSSYGLSEALRISRDKASQFIRRYFEVHKGIKVYCDQMIEYAKGHGYTETLFGFRREFPNINSVNHNLVEAEERMAVNAPVQGTAAEILKLAMINLDQKLGNLSTNEGQDTPRMILTVHDELVLEVPNDLVAETSALVKEIMENVVRLCVPLEVEVGTGPNWAEAKH